ncbi:hypothetical protein [Streptomyces fructofermentans]|uniref:hypothetical protein n=1 Tax=Streptomyces fructofermentans TaxID=152141 RepID=UPI00379771FB
MVGTAIGALGLWLAAGSPSSVKVANIGAVRLLPQYFGVLPEPPRPMALRLCLVNDSEG